MKKSVQWSVMSFLWCLQSAFAAGTIPAGLPQNELFFGVSSSPNDLGWMQSTQVPWKARYQYLVGGVNTGASWTTWGADFAFNYAKASQDAGYAPVFTYYQILHSYPHAGSGESEQVWNNLQNPSTMRAYFEDFKTALLQAARTGKTVLMHVEPDLWGYLHSRNIATDDANALSAAVSSSGHADVQGYPNTVAGFGRALVRLRDVYAPRVILAAHASLWSTGTDLSTDTSASVNVASIAQKQAKFLNSTGNWDLYFVDMSDRDAGWYQNIMGDGGRHWWDKADLKFPNFKRFHQWAAAFNLASQKRMIVWQIPVGNTISRTCNNTWGHYQDNRAEYYLENYPNNTHLRELAQTGVIGLLFGSGANGNTTPVNTMGDGVTNPSPVNGNSEVSSFTDDDGGYLRTRVQRYYQSGAVTFDPVVPPRVIYDNALQNGWMDWSWASHLLNLNYPVYAGNASIGVTFTPWSGLYFAHAGESTAGFKTLRMFVNGGARANPTLNIYAVLLNGNGPSVRLSASCTGASIPANSWVQCDVPLSALGALNTTLKGFVIQEGAGDSLPRLAIDDISLRP